MQVPSLNRRDSLKKEMATHSSILAWEIPWAKEPGRLQSMGSRKNQYVLRDSFPRPFPKHADTLFTSTEIFPTIPQKTISLEDTKHICARQDYKTLIIKRQTAEVLLVPSSSCWDQSLLLFLKYCFLPFWCSSPPFSKPKFFPFCRWV